MPLEFEVENDYHKTKVESLARVSLDISLGALERDF